MRIVFAILLTPLAWAAMNIISFIASFPLSWITAKAIVRGKQPKEIVSMGNNPVL